MARLEMLRDNRTKEYELGERTLLGRKTECEICVPSATASREHCRITLSDGNYYAENLSATNGTIINGEKITKHKLKHRDELSIGGILFRFLAEINDPLVNKSLGKYEIIEKIGAGGMGVVYRATQTFLGREVALKVLNQKFAEKESFIQSFEQEAKIAARLHHENIIGIHDFGRQDGWNYFSMEFVDGENLLDLITRQGALPLDEFLPIATQTALALAHAHENKILHKDIKPQNIMLTRDKTVKLADMGLASLMQSENDTAVKNQPILATPQYVPPEIIRRDNADQRSDIYSFCATLYQLLTGKPPYHAETLKDLLRMHLNAEIPNPQKLSPNIPDALAKFIMQGLSKEMVARPQTVNECLDVLRSIEITAQETPRLDATVSELPHRRVEREITTNEKVITLPAIYKKWFAAVGIVFFVLMLYFLFRGETPTTVTEIAPPQRKTVTAPKVIAPEITTPEITTPEITTPEITTPEITTPEITTPEITTPEITTPETRDHRYEWQKLAVEAMQKNNFASARKIITTAMQKTTGEEKSLAVTLLNELDKKHQPQVDKIFAEVRQLKNSGNFRQIPSTYQPLREIYAGDKIDEQILNELGEMNKKNTILLAQYWRMISEKIKSGDFVAAQQISQQFLAQSRRGMSFENAQRLVDITKYGNDFFTAVLQNAPPRTAKEIDFARVMIDGKEQKVNLVVRDNKLIAVGKKKSRPIAFTDINHDSLMFIAPASQLTPNAALGGWIFFALNGNTNNAYRTSANNAPALETLLGEFDSYLAGAVPLFDLANWQLTTEQKNTCVPRNNGLHFIEAGSCENWQWAIPLLKATIKIKGDSGISVELRKNNDNSLSFKFDQENIIATIKINGAMTTRNFAYPRGKLLNLFFSDNSLSVRAEDKTLTYFEIREVAHWNVAVIIHAENKNLHLRQFIAEIRD